MNAPAKGYFCIVQYCPDIARQEAANVGVLLFSPEHQFLGARMSPDNKRELRFFKTVADQPGHLATMKNALLERLRIERDEFRSLEDLQRFVNTRANKVILTPPKAVRVTQPQEDLDRLFTQMVTEPQSQEKARRERQPSLKSRLEQTFSRSELAAKIRRKVCVDVPTLNRKLEVPFGYQNGRFNLIQPVTFQQNSIEKATEHACQYAVEGDSIYRHPDQARGEMQLVIVGEFAHDEGRQAVSSLLSEYHVKLYTPETLVDLEQDIVLHGKVLA
jgi:hypothetical protein